MKPEQTGVSVVAIGTFNPSDFKLDRIRAAKALSENDIELAQYDGLLEGQLVSLVLPWGKVQAVAERISIEVTSAPYVRGPDLLLKMLRDASPTSTVTKLGINLTAHYRFATSTQRDKFAVKLAPPSAWGWLGKMIEDSFDESPEKHGGLMRITMRHIEQSDRAKGWIDITIEPSGLFGTHGVAITINDHYESAVGDSELLSSSRTISEELLTKLAANFDRSIERSFKICQAVLGDEDAGF